MIRQMMRVRDDGLPWTHENELAWASSTTHFGMGCTKCNTLVKGADKSGYTFFVQRNLCGFSPQCCQTFSWNRNFIAIVQYQTNLLPPLCVEMQPHLFPSVQFSLRKNHCSIPSACLLKAKIAPYTLHGQRNGTMVRVEWNALEKWNIKTKVMVLREAVQVIATLNQLVQETNDENM